EAPILLLFWSFPSSILPLSGPLLSRPGRRKRKMADHVIILHGLALNRLWMSGLAHSLKRRGYVVHNVTYPTLRLGFEDILEEHIKPLIDSIPGEKVDFAVHSMGGLLMRLYAQKYGTTRIGRV